MRVLGQQLGRVLARHAEALGDGREGRAFGGRQGHGPRPGLDPRRVVRSEHRVDLAAQVTDARDLRDLRRETTGFDVVDPCVGNGRILPEFELFHMLDTPFIERFGATGIRPEDVDVVFCTHLHSDHCGWNTMLRDGKYVPTFPNAKYYMGRREVERWDFRRPDYRHVPANAGIFENSVLPILEAGLAEVIGANQRITPSLEAGLANGHTMGHMALHLCSAGSHVWFTGDAFHHPIEFLHPELDANTCEDFALTLKTRNRLIESFVRQGALVIPAHFAAPHCGFVREEGGVRSFEPLQA